MNEVEKYIEGFSGEVKERLLIVRRIIRETVPAATERICMRMPTYDLGGKWFAHFAGYKNHIGFYPHAQPIEVFKEKLAEYKTSKGTVQFPHNKPLPEELIRDILLYKLKESKGK